MKINLKYGNINESLTARDAEDALHRFKGEAAKRAPFLMRGIVNAMSDLKFAQEVVTRANAQHKRNDPAPRSAQEFLDWGKSRGFITIEE